MTRNPDLQHGTSALMIARHIRNEINAGRLAHEAQLPGTRKLAEDWGVSVATINRAMAELAGEGLVVNRPRSSRLVHNPPKGDSPSTPKAVFIGGYAGSGKTELGRILARSTGWAVLDKDTTTRPVVEVALELLGRSPHDRESDEYVQVVRPAEYEAIAAAMAENIECGNSVIVTAPFVRELSDRAWCDRAAANTKGTGAELHVVWVTCDADTMRMYLRHRGAARDAAKLANWDGYLATIDVSFRPVINHYVVDNSVHSRPPLQEQATALLARIVT